MFAVPRSLATLMPTICPNGAHTRAGRPPVVPQFMRIGWNAKTCGSALRSRQPLCMKRMRSRSRVHAIQEHQPAGHSCKHGIETGYQSSAVMNRLCKGACGAR